MTLFPILIMVEESALGTVLRTLNGMPGIADFKLNLDEIAKKPGRQNGARAAKLAKPAHIPKPKGHGGPTAREIILGELLAGPKTAADLKPVVEAQGFSGDGVHPSIAHLMEKGIVVKVDRGLYRLSDAAMAELQKNAVNKNPTPVPTPALSPPESSSHKRFAPGEGQARMAKMLREHGGKLSRQDAIRIGLEAGISEKATSNALSRMKMHKQVRNPQPGLYELTAKGLKDFPMPEEATPPTNQEGQ